MRKEVERLILQARLDLENARKNVRIEACELYDEQIARAKVKAAEEVAKWVESLIQS